MGNISLNILTLSAAFAKVNSKGRRYFCAVGEFLIGTVAHTIVVNVPIQCHDFGSEGGSGAGHVAARTR